MGKRSHQTCSPIPGSSQQPEQAAVLLIYLSASQMLFRVQVQGQFLLNLTTSPGELLQLPEVEPLTGEHTHHCAECALLILPF
jgi:hypothetical protein